MSNINEMPGLKIGTVIHDIDNNEWVYIGYRVTTVNSYEHHFACGDKIKLFSGPWTYKAAHRKTLVNKFPDIENSLSKCQAVMYGDMTQCILCNLTWDTNDPDPPICNRGKKCHT